MYIIVPMSRNQTTTIHWKINKKQHSEFLSIMTRMVMRHGIIGVFIFTETCFYYYCFSISKPMEKQEERKNRNLVVHADRATVILCIST